jgi:sigma-E factor negative regulatory protein RseA
MNEQKREQLSALVDDELAQEASSVIESLLEDNDAKETWSRYHLIGNSLRGQLPEHIVDISSNVSQAIASEPTILAPAKKSSSRKSSDLMKPVMGFAIAASVAAVAIFNVQQANQISEIGQSPGTGQPVIAQSSIATSQPSLATSPQLVNQQTAQAQVYQVKHIDPRLNRYLVNYNEYRANTVVSGMPPHVRMVANDAESNEQLNKPVNKPDE